MLFELILFGGAAAVFRDNRRRRGAAPCQRLKKGCQSCRRPCGRKKGKTLVSAACDLITDRHRQQLRLELEPSQAAAMEKVRQQNQEAMILSWTAFSFSLLGKIILPLVWVSIAVILYLLTINIEEIKKDFQRKKYVSTNLIGLVMTLGLIVTGNIFFATISVMSSNFITMIVSFIEENSQQKIISIFNKQISKVWLLQNGVEVQTDFSIIQPGDIIVVNAGEMIPADGRITDGSGLVEQQLLSGESLPVEKSAGDEISATALLLSGRLEIAVADSGMAAEINELLARTQCYKDSLLFQGQRRYEQLAPITLGLSAVTLPALGADAALAVLWSDMGSIAADAGVGALFNFLQLLAQEGILVKDGRVFETLQKVDTVVFDKTGILTLPQPVVGKIHLFAGADEKTVLRHAAAAEQRQQHPIAQAVLARAVAEQLAVPLPEQTYFVTGCGVKVLSEGQTIVVGTASFLVQEGVVLPEAVLLSQQQAYHDGHSLVYVSLDNRLIGILEVETTLRPEAAYVIQQLKKRNIKCCILSGDHENTIRYAAEQLEIEEYFKASSSVDKYNYIDTLQKQGRSVCFIGDGLNDVIALKTAHISVSMKGATDAAINMAQIIFTDRNLEKLLNIFNQSEEFQKMMKRNYIISIAPSLFTVAGVYLLHFRLDSSFYIFCAGIFAAFCNTGWPILKRYFPI